MCILAMGVGFGPYARAANEGGGCVLPKAVDISVLPSASALSIDTSRSYKDMKNENIDTINPYDHGSTTYLNGYMDGTIGMNHATRLGFQKTPHGDGLCLWYDTIEINMTIEPKIVIAAEAAADDCMYEATLAHEKKHVRADREIVNKYAQVMAQKLSDGLSQRGFVAGPVPAADGEAIAERMRHTVGQLLDLEYKKMDLERREMQQEIDSLEEYNRVMALCPDYKPPGVKETRR
ncbi:MAG: hypothetical protein IT559_06395 [Alphaproteobacteria bacterium]|nr:hypothetical protein [Alphaproteobacteria bacterium]